MLMVETRRDKGLRSFQSLKHIRGYDEWLVNASTRFRRPNGKETAALNSGGVLPLHKCEEMWQ